MNNKKIIPIMLVLLLVFVGATYFIIDNVKSDNSAFKKEDNQIVKYDTTEEESNNDTYVDNGIINKDVNGHTAIEKDKQTPEDDPVKQTVASFLAAVFSYDKSNNNQVNLDEACKYTSDEVTKNIQSQKDVISHSFYYREFKSCKLINEFKTDLEGARTFKYRVDGITCNEHKEKIDEVKSYYIVTIKDNKVIEFISKN